jgi:hypothetical protein
LLNKSLNNEGKLKLFGKCNSDVSRHDYKVITGWKETDPVTAMVVNLTNLIEHIKEGIMKSLDH